MRFAHYIALTFLLFAGVMVWAAIPASITTRPANSIYGSNDSLSVVSSITTNRQRIAGTNYTFLSTNWHLSNGYLVFSQGSTNSGTNAWTSYLLIGTNAIGTPLSGVSSGSFVLGGVTNMYQTNTIPAARVRVSGVSEVFPSTTNVYQWGQKFGQFGIQRQAFYGIKTNASTGTNTTGLLLKFYHPSADPSLTNIVGVTIGVESNQGFSVQYTLPGATNEIDFWAACDQAANVTATWSFTYWGTGQ